MERKGRYVMNSLNELLISLEHRGCYPAISLRAPGVWRAHVNATGNYWDEGETPYVALRGAVDVWVRAGKKMDGYASKDNQ